jgi:hypothetical protein
VAEAAGNLPAFRAMARRAYEPILSELQLIRDAASYSSSRVPLNKTIVQPLPRVARTMRLLRASDRTRTQKQYGETICSDHWPSGGEEQED